MTASVPRHSATESSDRIAKDLRQHGAVIVEGVLDSDLLRCFNDELDPLLELLISIGAGAVGLVRSASGAESPAEGEPSPPLR